MAKRVELLVALLCVFSVVLLAGCGKKPGQADFNAGIRALERHHYNKSIKLFQKSISRIAGKKESAVVYNYLGVAYSRAGQNKEAIQALETGIQANPFFVEPVYNLGVLMLGSGNEDKAIVYFEKAAMTDTSQTRALEYLGHLYCRRAEWNSAKRVLNEAQRRAPRSPQILTARALLELQTGNVKKAVSFLQQALEHDACYPPAVYNLGAVNKQWLNNGNQAAAYFKDYIHLSPEGPYSDKARHAMKEIRTALPSSADAVSNRIVILKDTSKDKPPAERKSTRLVKKTKRASATGLKQKTGAPESEMSRPPVPTFDELMKTARILQRHGRREAAANNFLRAVREAQRTGKQTCQQQALSEAVNVCSGNARANYAVGQYFSDQQQNSTAMTHFKKAVSLSTNWYDAQMALAKAAIEQGEIDTAVVSLKQADQSRPHDPEALWALSRLYDRNLGLTNPAVKCYIQFGKRFADDARVSESLERLKVLTGR